MCFGDVKSICSIKGIFNITSSLKQDEESLVFKAYSGELGPALLLTRGVDFDVKKLLKWFALILKSESTLLFISRSGIIGNVFPL